MNNALRVGGEKLIAAAREEAYDLTSQLLRDGMDGPPGSWSQSFQESLDFTGANHIEGAFFNNSEHGIFVEEDTSAHTHGPPPSFKIEEYLSRHGDLTGDPFLDYLLIEKVREKIELQGTQGKFIMRTTRAIVTPKAHEILGETFRALVF